MDKKVKYTVCALVGAAFLMLALFFIVGEPKKEFTIVFDSDGGTSISSQTVTEGEKIVKPTNPTKENNNFLRWEYQNKEYNFNSEVTSDMTLKAIWEGVIDEKVYDITFTVDGVTKTLSLSKITEEDLASLGFKEKDGYELKWYVDDVEYDFNTPLTGNVNLTGKYVKTTTYTVKFNSDGGTTVPSQKVNPNEKASEPSGITKYGFIFDGWYLNNKKYDFNTPVTSNITLKAKWSEDTNIKRYEVTFDSDGGTKVDKQRVIENNKATEPKKPTKNGYKFLGWYLGENKYDFNSKVTSDINLVAKWEKIIQYTVTFNKDNGTENETRLVNSGEKVTKPKDPSKTGYRFTGWLYENNTFDFNTPITKDMTLTASYVALKKYTVTFDSNGGSSVGSQTVYEGNKATKPNNPTKDDHDFVEWQLNGSKYSFDTVVTGDITLVAKWQVRPTEYEVEATKVDEFSPDSYIKVYRNKNYNTPIDFNKITCNGKTITEKLSDGRFVANNDKIRACGSTFTVVLTNGTSVKATKKS